MNHDHVKFHILSHCSMPDERDYLLCTRKIATFVVGTANAFTGKMYFNT